MPVLSLLKLNVAASSTHTRKVVLRGGGGAGRKTILLIFQPSHFIVIYFDQYEKIWRKKKISRGWFPWK